MLIKCPNCGKEISDKAPKCVGCGWMPEKIRIEQNAEETDVLTTENSVLETDDLFDKSNTPQMQGDIQKKVPNKNEIIEGMKRILLIGTCVFGILAIILFYRANNVKNEYYNSEDYSILNKNAYVGGDAYNYIINGTYFTGYAVIGAGCMICSVVMGTSFIMTKIKQCME